MFKHNNNTFNIIKLNTCTIYVKLMSNFNSRHQRMVIGQTIKCYAYYHCRGSSQNSLQMFLDEEIGDVSTSIQSYLAVIPVMKRIPGTTPANPTTPVIKTSVKLARSQTTSRKFNVSAVGGLSNNISADSVAQSRKLRTFAVLPNKPALVLSTKIKPSKPPFRV